MTTSEGYERRELWLSWLELPWDQVRVQLLNEMKDCGMTQDDLSYELRREGFRVSHGTINNWLTGKVTRVPLQALQALVAVFARVRAGVWAKGASLTQLEFPMPDETDGVGRPARGGQGISSASHDMATVQHPAA